MDYDDGIAFATERNIFVSEYKSTLKAFSVDMGGYYAIAINHDSLLPQEDVVAIFHEIGHCETGSFYNPYSPFEVRKKHENRADEWAANKLIPPDELERAISDGYMEMWELSDKFGVTEAFIRNAIQLYLSKGLLKLKKEAFGL